MAIGIFPTAGQKVDIAMQIQQHDFRNPRSLALHQSSVDGGLTEI
jgi:hypothetical protein